MPRPSTTNSWLFPPQTREAQFDEKWSFVGKKEKHCDPAQPEDARQGDNWDHVAFDPELLRHWLPVDMYVGGPEHARGHLIFARFVNLVLHDAGLVACEEPFSALRHQGIVTHKGHRMSKGKGNVDCQTTSSPPASVCGASWSSTQSVLPAEIEESSNELR